MIVWINGPFGVGKSTLGELLARRWPEAVLVDPERPGYVLSAWQAPQTKPGDFQHLASWRQRVREGASGLLRDFKRPLIIPMTLLNPDSFDEIVGSLRKDGITVLHFCLTARKDQVMARVRERNGDGDWYAHKFLQYERFVIDDRFETHISTSRVGVDQVFEQLLGALPRPLPTEA